MKTNTELEQIIQNQINQLSEFASRLRSAEIKIVMLEKLLSAEKESFLEKTRPNVLPDISYDDPILAVKQIVSHVCGVKLDVMRSTSRGYAQNAWARQLAMFFCDHHHLGTGHHIAKAFGKSCHGTVLHAKKIVQSDITTVRNRRYQYDLCQSLIIQYFFDREINIRR